MKKSAGEKFDKYLEEITESKTEDEQENAKINFIMENFFEDDFQMMLKEQALFIANDKDCEETLAEELRRFAHSLDVINALMFRNVMSHERDEEEEDNEENKEDKNNEDNE